MRCFGIKEFSCSFFLFTSYASWTGGDLSELRQQKLTANVEEREREGGRQLSFAWSRKERSSAYHLCHMRASSLFPIPLHSHLFSFCILYASEFMRFINWVSFFIFILCNFFAQKRKEISGSVWRSAPCWGWDWGPCKLHSWSDCIQRNL